MREKKVRVVLTIAGFDPGSGAGITADLKTFSRFGVYGTSVITALTSQNHKKFFSSGKVSQDIIRSQLDSVFSCYKVSAVKIGLLSSSSTASLVAGYLSKKSELKIVTDPVFSATAGRNFIDKEILKLYKEMVFPVSSLVTPNVDELSGINGSPISGPDELKREAGKFFERFNVPVLAKGGHLEGEAIDFLVTESGITEYKADIIGGIDTHGSGCILSSAICANLALGHDLKSSVFIAKEFMNKILESGRVVEGVGKILDTGTGKFSERG